MQPFDTLLGLKLFSLVGSEPGKVSVTSHTLTTGVDVSLSDILSEEQWKGRRIYKMRVNRRFSSQFRTFSGLTNATITQAETNASMLFEIDLQTHTLCGETVQVLTLRNLSN